MDKTQIVRGFTMIEMVITIAIIGILSALVAPSMVGFQRDGDLRLSRDIVETELSKAFSSSRSHPRIFGVIGMAGENTVLSFSCLSNNSDCDERESKIVKLSAQLEEDFEIRYLPPHGDIDPQGFPDDTKTLAVKSGDLEPLTMIVYKKSGFIQKR